MILGLVERDLGELSLELLAFGRELAGRLSTELHVAVAGPAAEQLAVSKVHVVQHPRLDESGPEPWAESVVQLMAAVEPEVVLAPGSEAGNEVMAHVAARTGLPMAANCTHVEPRDPFVVTRVQWGGSLLQEAELTGAVKLLTVAPHAVSAGEASSDGDVEIVQFVPELSDTEFRVRFAGRVEPEGDRVSLPEARVVVGGGRGLGSAEAFAQLEELVALLGGAVGCSRAVTSLGWRPHSDQIGQTGTRIAPDLYIACGISGAIQHMVGCEAAKRILVINTDPHAPILARADYAVIGDVGEVVPALNSELRKAAAGAS